MSSDYTSRARLYRESLDDAFREDVPSGEALSLLAGTVERCRASGDGDETVAGALEAFDAIVERRTADDAVSEAASWFESPQRFREALFFLRCLDRDAEAALALMRQRAYLSAAVVPPAAYAALSTEQAGLLDRTTFEALWAGPDALHDMEEAIHAWRRGYVPAYTAAHGDYNRHMAGIAADVEAAQWQTDAVEKLNLLVRLGEPVAQPSLVRFHALETHSPCPADAVELGAELAETPICPHCGYRLGEVPPVQALNDALIDIERGFATQTARLARRAVNPLLARTGRPQDERLDRMVRVVQASDLAGLAQVLDEGMMEFLGDVLQTPEPRVNLIDRLAQDYPEVTSERVDEVVAAFRSLVEEELARGGGRLVIGREDGA